MNGASGFAYDAIDASSQVRLLQADPESLNYSLKTFDLSDLPLLHFIAISHVWGSAMDSQDIYDITVDDRTFCVRKNLYDFLVTCNNKGVGGLLFIDAICIDQLNVAERRDQVKQMARIYRSADLVIAWLGVPTPRDQRAVDLFSQEHNTATRYPRLGAKQWYGFRYLSYHPYWSRVWIVQEVLFARNLTVWCGRHIFPSSLFMGIPSDAIPEPGQRFSTDRRPQTAVNAVSGSRSPAEQIMMHRDQTMLRTAVAPLSPGANVAAIAEILRNIRDPHTLVESYPAPEPDPLHEVIRLFGKHNCADPRDKLYGFLGLIAASSRAGVDPDYSRDITYAYDQALKLGLEEIHNEYAATHHPIKPRDAYAKYLAYYFNQSFEVLRGVVLRIRIEAQHAVRYDWRQGDIPRGDANPAVFDCLQVLLGISKTKPKEDKTMADNGRGSRRWFCDLA
ncbi:HET-domain-containing protein [Hypoxylon sp. FL1150]|nr:HET-domain-containing protein [Hypoxylon sp. FL1150]